MWEPEPSDCPGGGPRFHQRGRTRTAPPGGGTRAPTATRTAVHGEVSGHGHGRTHAVVPAARVPARATGADAPNWGHGGGRWSPPRSSHADRDRDDGKFQKWTVVAAATESYT